MQSIFKSITTEVKMHLWMNSELHKDCFTFEKGLTFKNILLRSQDFERERTQRG